MISGLLRRVPHQAQGQGSYSLIFSLPLQHWWPRWQTLSDPVLFRTWYFSHKHSVNCQGSNIFLNFYHDFIEMKTEEAPVPTTTQLISKLAIKLPDFFTDDPDLWFLQGKAAFRNSQVTQSWTNFGHVIQKLPQNIMVSVFGLIMNSASSSYTPYEIGLRLNSFALAEG